MTNVYLPMGKNQILIALTFLVAGCSDFSKRDGRARLPEIDSSAKHAQPEALLTDSAKLVTHIDTLTIPAFPLNTEKLLEAREIDLSAFKSKALRGLSLKPHERNIGGAIIDGDPSYKFDLVDSAFQAKWILLAKKQKYFAVLIDETLVTLNYNLKVIDAIHVLANDPAGNSHFHGILSTTIYSNMKFTLSYYYEIQVDDKGTYDHQMENDLWLVDHQGHFKFKKTEVVETTNNDI